MKAVPNRIAAMLSYVPAPAKAAQSISAVKIDVEIGRTLLDAAHADIKRLAKAALRARTIVASIRVPAVAQFATTKLRADETQSLILAELRKQTTLLEVLAKQGDRAAFARGAGASYGDLCPVIRPATGAAASGLPG